jgi:light-regulated signal transduction histidine kinase (bacteriophytochrome)
MILNVDDHEPGRYARTRLLTAAGYKVAEAKTGVEALTLVASLRPSLVMLDVNLPDIDGLEICRRIKADPALALTPVLQVSASAVSSRDRVGGLDNGADAYLIEPVDSDVLLATVRALLRMRKAEADLAAANEALVLANDLLHRKNEDLQRFAYMASHDLQEPLRTVATYAALLVRRYGGRLDGDAEEFLTHIQRGASRMSLLIQGLLMYAKAGLEGDEANESVDLNEILTSTLKDLEQSIVESGASIQHGELPVVKGSQVLLTQLFQNLIHNALKYCNPGQAPAISVTAEGQNGSMTQVVIADNGVGVPREYQQTIFAPFRRLHGFEVPGSGIGLATCQRIVERQGGRIWVESEGAGAGSRFCFTLPRST